MLYLFGWLHATFSRRACRISYEVISACSDYISSRSKHKPKIGIICGSGLGSPHLTNASPDPCIGGLATLAKNADIFPYSEIPGFPQSTVAGHVGRYLAASFRWAQFQWTIITAAAAV